MKLRLLAALLTLAAVSGCGPKPSAPQDAVAIVNGTPIPAQDLKREISLRTAQNPSFKPTPQAIEDQLNVMVNRRLLIDEAVGRKLSEQEGFKTSIRLFWEQTLIRLLMDDLTREFAAKSSVTDAEVKELYGKLNFRMVFEILRSKDKASAEQALAALTGEAMTWDEKTAAVTYDQVNSEILEQAFELAAGEAKIFEKDGVWYLIRAASKETVTPPALETITEQLKARIKQRKERLAFETWIKEKRAQADIKITPQG